MQGLQKHVEMTFFTQKKTGAAHQLNRADPYDLIKTARYSFFFYDLMQRLLRTILHTFHTQNAFCSVFSFS